MNKKTRGFTLVELLAVVIILGVILLLAVPSVVGIIYNVKEDSFYNQLTLLTTMGETYLLENNVAFDDNGEAKITLQQLIDTGYAPSYVVDPRCNGYFYTEDTYLTVTLTNNSIIDVSIYAATECGEDGTGSGSYDSSTSGSVGSGSGSTGGTSSGGSSSGGSTGGTITPTVPDGGGDYIPDDVATYLVLDNGLTPVVWNGSNWEVADIDKAWYNYDNKEWANAVALNQNAIYEAGNVITESDVLAYFVYIPRYKYQIFNATTTAVDEQPINIVFQSVTDEKATGTSTGSWLTHPAFTFGDEELAGIWVGKYEVTGTTSALTIKPNLSSLRSTTVSAFFYAIQSMSASGNSYGISTSADAHMMKNIEWGAVAYLTSSIYGKNEEVYINNTSTYTTGCGATTASASSSSSCALPFGVANQPQSTTGNATGVYDMSGGAWEYVMGVNNETVGSSGFATTFFTYGTNTKYYDNYSSGTTYNDTTAYSRRILGDATSETRGWYSDYSNFVYTTYPWFLRGGHSTTTLGTTTVGVFAFNCPTQAGGGYTSISARVVVLP